MKRSEMKEKLIESLKYAQAWQPRFDIIAEIILNDIEKTGMLPPIRGNKSAFNTVFDEIDPTWEPEEAKSVEGEGHYTLDPEDFDKLLGEDND